MGEMHQWHFTWKGYTYLISKKGNWSDWNPLLLYLGKFLSKTIPTIANSFSQLSVHIWKQSLTYNAELCNSISRHPQNSTAVFLAHSAQVSLQFIVDVFTHIQNTVKSSKLWVDFS